MRVVLIADDEPGFRYLLELILKRAGYKTLAASDGREVLHLIYHYFPAIAILDEDMPGIQGSDVCRCIKSDSSTSHIPVIIHSASHQLMRSAYREYAGADAFLYKPSLPREIVDKVADLLRKKTETPLPSDQRPVPGHGAGRPPRGRQRPVHLARLRNQQVTLRLSAKGAVSPGCPILSF